MAPKRLRNGRVKKQQASTKSEVRNMVKSMIASTQEHKDYAFSLSAATDYSASGAVYGLTTQVVQGDDIVNRSGDVITLKNLRLTWSSANSVAGLTARVAIRSIIFADTMSSGSAPAVTDVLDTASWISGYNNINKQRNRFIIYSDVTYDMVSETQSALKTKTFNIVPNRKVYYNAANGFPASVGKNHLFHILISSGTGAAGQYVYSTYATLRYTDS
jgi:hypothetical protein